jgi:hypothetical protein
VRCGILGTTLAPNAALAPLPVSLLVVGVAANTLPPPLFMQRFERKLGFVVRALAACGAILLAAWAVAHGNFTAL